MTTLYKLTNGDGFTRAGQSNALQWRVGVTHTATGKGTTLCTDGVLHAYKHPLLAVLLNPIHADFDAATMRLWRCEGEIVAREGQLKCGVKSLTVVEELPVPVVTTEQRVTFAILCAKEVCTDARWNTWADKWLSSEDRTEAAAEASLK